MPALGFQKQFVMPILTGTKTSTIRALRKDGRPPCKPGDRLKLYYGMRTKQCELISEVRCKTIDSIALYTPNKIYPFIFQNGFYHGVRSHDRIAAMEGFESRRQMRDWFVEHHQIDQKPFRGWHIQWEAL